MSEGPGQTENDAAANRRRAMALTVAGATLLTLLLAWPVLLHPTERVFGTEIVGRHHDPFTVIQQIAGGPVSRVHLQPATDWVGRAFAWFLPPVSAYNLLVLLTFPLAAWCAYLFAFAVTESVVASVFAGFVFAFAPFHLAHAAYHPHISQVHWVPLYLLALWRSAHRFTGGGAVVLAATAAVAVLANAYHALVLAAVTPGALLLFWLTPRRGGERASASNVVKTGVFLAAAAVVAVAALRLVAPAVFSPGVVVSRDELFVYSARWWAYLVPPVGHWVLGDRARQVWAAYGIGDGLLEQQVFIGWSVVVLCGVSLVRWWRDRTAFPCVPACLALAFIAVFCSISPERLVWGVGWHRPSALFYLLMPMFRSYARFAVVVQCCVAVVAGVGLAALWNTRRTRLVAVGLLAATLFEYAPSQPGWRDVLPTSAHRWLVRNTSAQSAFDCAPWTVADSNLSWLAGRHVELFGNAVPDCAESELASKLRALGFHYLVVRSDGPQRRYAPGDDAPGFSRIYAAADGEVFAIDDAATPLYLSDFQGAYPREYLDGDTWRWAGRTATLALFNGSAATTSSSLRIELGAFGFTRHVQVSLDGAPVADLVVPGELETFDLGPFTVTPGRHALRFESREPATSPAAERPTDTRPLAFRIARWSWGD